MSEAASAPADIKPVIASPARGSGPWIFGGGLIIAGALLFYTLESRRAALTSPAIAAPRESAERFIASPPVLDLPADRGAPQWWPYPPYARREAMAGQGQTPIATSPVRPARVPASSPPVYPPPGPYSGSYVPPLPQPEAQASREKPVIPGAESFDKKERVSATLFVNPATTVPKGTVIQAVLESALDSTRAGFARAIVSRDAYSFDGSRVLVPRGSRLIGEYKADLALGQSRVLIEWQRLMRPDGAIINIDSPAADTLGRAGVKGKVNTHFFQRFAGAILQSALDIGVQLATREVNSDTVVVGLPGSTMQGLVVAPEKIQPTLKIPQGNSVSVFVARDLDFTAVSK